MRYLSANLKYLRKKSGKSQADIAFQVKKQDTTISSWEGGNSNPSLDDIEILAEYFAVKPELLIYSDLTSVQVSENEKPQKNDQNVQGNVQVSVQVKEKKEAKVTSDGKVIMDASARIAELESNNAALKVGMSAMEAYNAQLKRDLAMLQGIMRLEKSGIPEIGKGHNESGQQAAG